MESEEFLKKHEIKQDLKKLIKLHKEILDMNFNNQDLYILTDFDGTITKDNSDSSWASIFKNPKVSKEFINECIKIFNHYHKFEIAESLSIAKKINYE